MMPYGKKTKDQILISGYEWNLKPPQGQPSDLSTTPCHILLRKILGYLYLSNLII
jgi:hypothetical protein